jgi:hypothetical protein
VRRLAGIVLALQTAAGLLVPLSALALGRSRESAAMACCMMHGRCDCAHSDSSFARCTGQDTLQVSAIPVAPPADSSGPVGAPAAGELVVSEDHGLRSLLDPAPPTPPPRAA